MLNVQDLRKIFSAQGVKGFGSANRATFTAAIEAAHAEALEIEEAALIQRAIEQEAAQAAAEGVELTEVLTDEAIATLPAKPKKGTCEDCGRKVGKSGHKSLCEPCLDYAGWENTHNDDSHGDPALAEQAESEKDCPVCHPELDPRTAKKTGRSRMGMVIVAKGSEVHKSETFRVAAEAAGWSVNVLGYVTEDDAEEERYVATATKGDDTIELAWNGRAYDYPASGATFGGKARKVRNLKEALRLL